MHSPDTPRFLEAPDAELGARRAATRLRNILRLNAGFSIVTGVSALLAAGPVADVLGTDRVWLLRALGAGLLVFAGIVLAIAGARTSRLRRLAQLVSLADLGWVAGTVGVVVAGWVSTSGAIVLAAIGVVVLELGLLQLRVRRHLVVEQTAAGAALDESPPVEVIAFTRSSQHSVEALWPVMTDHALYAELALNLKAAEGLTPNGPGFRRTCTDSAGRKWSETCTLWEPGRRFDVEVDISEYPYPLQQVQGSWGIDPDRHTDATDSGTTSTVSMRFAVQPKPGVAGRLFIPVMHLLFRPILGRIARGWDRAAARQRANGAPSPSEGVAH